MTDQITKYAYRFINRQGWLSETYDVDGYTYFCGAYAYDLRALFSEAEHGLVAKYLDGLGITYERVKI